MNDADEDAPALIPYPNPTNDIVRLSGAERLDGSMPWRLVDALGRTLRQGRMAELVHGVHLAGTAAGAYHLVFGEGQLPALPLRIVK